MNAPAKIPAVEAPGADMPRWLPHALVALIIATLVVSLAAMAIWEERIRYRERAEVATQNVSHMLDLHLSSVFDKIDVVLQSTVAQYQEQLAGGKVRPLELKLYLERQQSLVPEIISLRIIDRDGVVRYGAGIPGGGPVNLGDREYFLRARDGSASELIIAGPLMGRIAKQWVVTLSRRIEAPDGTFAGVVYAAIPTVHFERILASVSLGPRARLPSAPPTWPWCTAIRAPATPSAAGRFPRNCWTCCAGTRRTASTWPAPVWTASNATMPTAAWSPTPSTSSSAWPAGTTWAAGRSTA